MNQYIREDRVDLSEYEEKRLANIKRNNDRLVLLGLVSFTIPGGNKSGKTVKRIKNSLSTGPIRKKLDRIAKIKAIKLQIKPDGVAEKIGKTKYKSGVNRRSSAKPEEKIDMVSGIILQRYESGCAAAIDVKGHQSLISLACNQLTKSHKGYYWQFVAGVGGMNNKVIKPGMTRVCKQFVNEKNNELKYFMGMVSYKCGEYYRIVYDDGDSEEMTWKDVLLYKCQKKIETNLIV